MLILAMVISIGIVFFYMLNEWAEGAYGGLDAAITALMLIGLIVASYHLMIAYSPFIGSLPVAFAVGYIFYRRKYSNGREILRDNVDRYRRMVRAEPKNLAAREKLANALYDLGELDQALYEIKSAVNMGGGPTCEHALKKWTLERKVLVDGIPVCRWCDTENKVGERYCVNCGFELPYDTHMTRKLFAGKKTNKLLGTILIFSGTMVALAVLTGLTSAVFVPIALGIIAYWGWQIVRGARS